MTKQELNDLKNGTALFCPSHWSKKSRIEIFSKEGGFSYYAENDILSWGRECPETAVLSECRLATKDEIQAEIEEREKKYRELLQPWNKALRILKKNKVEISKGDIHGRKKEPVWQEYKVTENKGEIWHCDDIPLGRKEMEEIMGGKLTDEQKADRILAKELIGWWVTSDGFVVKFALPKGALVYPTRICLRTNEIKVLEIIGKDGNKIEKLPPLPNRQEERIYYFKVGETYISECFETYDIAWGSGIYFFLTKEEAEQHFADEEEKRQYIAEYEVPKEQHDL